MINSNEGSHLNKSEWVNDFDLVKSLNSTARYPLLGERILPDESDIDPSPVSSQIGSQEVEMTSKTNFVEKNAPVSVVVPPKKKKVADITNNQQENLSDVNRVKGGLFKKSKGKENSFRVDYAESDASVMSDVNKEKTPKNMLQSSVDSIVSDLTFTFSDIKKNVFQKGKESNRFDESDDSDDESILRRDLNHESMHISITNPAVHLTEKNYNASNNFEAINKSIDLKEKSIGEGEKIVIQTENSEASTHDVTITQNGLSSLGDITQEKVEDYNSSISTNLSLSPYEKTRKSKAIFERKKRVSFSEKTEAVSSSLSIEEDRKEEPSLSETASPFVALKRPFSGRVTRSKKQDFNVSSEETVTSTVSEKVSKENFPMATQVSSPKVDSEEADKSVENSFSDARNAKKSVAALRSKKTDGFQVDFDNTESTPQQDSGPPSLLETSSFIAPKRPFSRPSTRSKRKDFHVSLEETVSSGSKKASDTLDSPFSSIPFQKPTPSKKSLPFARRTIKEVSFAEVDFEETGSDVVQEKSAEKSLSDTGSARAVRKSVFARKSRKMGFQVDFDKTESSPQEGSESKVTPHRDSEPKLTPRRKAESPHERSESEVTPRHELEPEVTPRRESTKEATPPLVSESETHNSILNQSGSSRKRKEKEVEMDTFNFFPDSSDRSLPRQDFLFGKRPRKEDDFNVSFEESQRKIDSDKSLDRTDRTSPRKKIFNKKKSTASFEVPLEETDLISTQESDVSMSDKKKIFQKKSSTPKFETTFDETDPISSVSKISAKGNGKFSLQPNNSPLSSVRSRNSEATFGSVSERSLNVTVIDKTAKSLLTKTNAELYGTPTNDSVYTDHGEISYDDGNLNGFLSDSSEEERHVPKVVPPPNPKSLPSNYQGNLENLELRFKKMVENAKTETGNRSLRKEVSVPKKKIQPVPQKGGKAPGRRKFKRPADYATKRLYDFLENKLKPVFKTDAIIEAEKLVECICETVNIVTRRTTHQKNAIDSLKKKMAKLKIVETTADFYQFVRNYLPDSFRYKVIPSVRPLTNAIYPPFDIVNPFDKIL